MRNAQRVFGHIVIVTIIIMTIIIIHTWRSIQFLVFLRLF